MDNKVINAIKDHLLKLFQDVHVLFNEEDKRYEFIVLDDSATYLEKRSLACELYRNFNGFKNSFIIMDDILGEYQHLKKHRTETRWAEYQENPNLLGSYTGKVTNEFIMSTGYSIGKNTIKQNNGMDLAA